MVIANRWTHPSWNPLSEWQVVQREFAKRLSESYATPRSATAPPIPVELRTGDRGALLVAALPGVAPEDLEVSVERNLLSISAKSKADSTTPAAESAANSSIQRSLRLPFRIDTEGVVATMRDGMLEVRLPKAAEDAPKKIQVQTQETADATTQEN